MHISDSYKVAISLAVLVSLLLLAGALIISSGKFLMAVKWLAAIPLILLGSACYMLEQMFHSMSEGIGWLVKKLNL